MSREEIQAWLIAQIADRLSIAPEKIDIREPFTNYGLSSRDAVTLSGDLEELLGRRLSPTLVYEYPSIATLSRYLAGDSETTRSAAQVHAPSASTKEPIAIIGIACRFPGANNPRQFWHLLRDGIDAISEVPADRWDAQAFYHPDATVPGKAISRWGGFLDRIDQFDPFFFGISPSEAERMDPQQRLLLELSYEALENAGQAKEHIAGSDTGVFVGISVNEYSLLQFSDPLLITGHSGAGNALSIAANRISYFFDFRGPSIAIDTACSSSLAAVHLACRSLARGECELALVGGVNLILSPAHAIAFTKAGALAADGRCKAFDARANGYVRGEGAGVIVLKPLARARSDRDPIYAVILGSAMNQDGRTNGLMAPSRASQEAMLREAYRDAEVAPNHVQYVEAHGTGTLLGDPIEAKALGAVLGLNRSNGACALGSVKTNLGHLEAAAGIAGLIKVALSLKHQAIPPSLHYENPNPHIPFDELHLRVQNELASWPQNSGLALAGVSSFGFGGTNVHVVMQGAKSKQQKEKSKEPSLLPVAPCHLLPFSAHTPEALQALARAYEMFLASNSEISLHDVCYTASARRSHHDYRLAIAGRSREELIASLQAFQRGESYPNLSTARHVSGRRHKLVFVFPGQGSQWHGMGCELLKHEPVFREAIARCDQAMRQHVEWSLLKILQSEVAQTWLNAIDVVQPALFAIQVALAALWRVWGIEPDAVVGHSMGEVAAAHVAGILSLEDATRIICRRSRLLKRVAGQGTMMVVELPLDQAKQLLHGYEDRIALAASNSPTLTVLSGEPAAMQALMESLQRQNLFCRLVNVDVASHSPQMDSLREDLLHALDGLQPSAAALPIYSTVTGAPGNAIAFDADYWMRNLREPVLFSTAIARLLESDHGVFIELSPHPILLSAIQQTLLHGHREGLTVPSLKREEPERAAMLGVLGMLYTQGFPIAWNKLYPNGGECVSLPLYPWQRQRFWLDARTTASSSLWHRSEKANAKTSPLLGEQTKLAHPPGAYVWQTQLDLRRLVYLEDHRIEDEVLFPAAAYVEMALQAAAQTGLANSHVLTDFVFSEKLLLPTDAVQPVQAMLLPDQDGFFSFHVYSHQQENWILHASAGFAPNESEAELSAPDCTSPATIQQRCTEQLAAEEFYSALLKRGIQYGKSFRGVERVWRREDEALGRIKLPELLEYESSTHQIHPALLDACLQVLAAMLNTSPGQYFYLPNGCRQFKFYSRPDHLLWSHVLLRPNATPEANVVEADIRLWDEADHLVAELLGFRLQRVTRRARPVLPRDTWLYQVRWQAAGMPEQASLSAPRGRHWIIFADEKGLGQNLATQLEARGDSCHLVACDEVSKNLDRVDDFIRQRIEEVLEIASSPPYGIIHLWSLEALPSSETSKAALEMTQALGCNAILRLVQALARRALGSPRLWLVTRGAQPVQAGEQLSIAPSSLWGLGKVISFEFPELKCTRIDLDPTPKSSDEITLLLKQLFSHDDEDQIAWRGGVRYVPRLLPYTLSHSSCATAARLRPENTYLITGGMGGLGLTVAKWMVQQGAQHLVLLGRNEPSASANSVVSELRKQGVEIVIVNADVTNAEQLTQVFGEIENSMPPLRGVVHAAGVLDDAALINLDAKRMTGVMAPKVYGTWNLHTATMNLPLDFFILFSSAVSVLGSPGQGNYAAASTFLDAVAHYRRSLGLPAVSINWGPWAEVGLAAAATDQLKERGASTQHLVKVITPAQGVEVLEQLLAAPIPQIMVLPFDLSHLLELYPAAAGMRFFAEVGGKIAHGARLYARPKLRQEYVAPRNEIEQKLVELWRQTLHIDRVGIHDSFFELGGDSVLAAQIVTLAQKTFGIRINLQDAFKAFTIEKLAEMLEVALIDKIEEMSESEAQRLLKDNIA